MKVDKRKRYILVLDTETANTIMDEKGKLDMSNVLVYDCGWQVIDKKGTVYESASFVNSDIFIHERELMRTAYYSSKIPRYVEDLRAGRRTMATTAQIRAEMMDTINRWNVKVIAAHNARFDYNALNGTRRWTTKSAARYWFPYGEIEIWDTMRMATDVICKMPTYKAFCEKHGFLTARGQVRKTAEVLWRFISKNPDFIESHTGLEDVQIESEILVYCFRQHKAMRKRLFENSPEPVQHTPFQIALMQSLKNTPTIAMA